MRKAPKTEEIGSEIDRALRDAKQARSGLRQVLRRCASPDERMMIGRWLFLLNHHLVFLEDIEKDELVSAGKRYQAAVWSMVQIIQSSVDTIIETWL